MNLAEPHRARSQLPSERLEFFLFAGEIFPILTQMRNYWTKAVFGEEILTRASGTECRKKSIKSSRTRRRVFRESLTIGSGWRNVCIDEQAEYRSIFHVNWAFILSVRLSNNNNIFAQLICPGNKQSNKSFYDNYCDNNNCVGGGKDGWARAPPHRAEFK